MTPLVMALHIRLKNSQATQKIGPTVNRKEDRARAEQDSEFLEKSKKTANEVYQGYI